MNYQHYQAYGATHYPQYTPQHYTQYAAQTATIPTAPTATTSTSTTSAAPLSRQATQTPAVETDQNADISTLNDAVGSAGLDLRVSGATTCSHVLKVTDSDYNRRKKRLCSAHRIIMVLTGAMRIDREDNRIVQPSIRGY